MFLTFYYYVARAIGCFLGKFFILLASLSPNIITGKRLKVLGIPLIDIRRGGKITIGDGVVLNSLNRGYHLNMYGPVKFMADAPGAEIIIGANTRINGACIHARCRVIVGSRCLIGANTNIIDSNGHLIETNELADRLVGMDNPKPVHISDDVWIGANCMILPGVIIGRGAVVAAGSIVNRDVPERVVVAGCPAREVKRLSTKHKI